MKTQIKAYFNQYSLETNPLNLFSFVANLNPVNNKINFMAKTTKKTSEVTPKAKSSVSRQALAEYIADISAKCLTPNESLIHCTIAINQILTNAESSALLDDDLKGQLKDVWLKLKSMGIHLEDPPMLFGLPEGFLTEGLAN